MSWKGFKKAFVRLPHQITSKVSKGNTTQDSEFGFLVKEVKALESQVKILYSRAAEFRDNVNGMLSFQNKFLEVMADMLGPVDFALLNENQTKYSENQAESSLRGISESYSKMVSTIVQNIQPKLDSFDTNIISPLMEISGLIKNMNSVIDKRNHKLIDYDRHRSTYEKYETKGFQPGGRSLPDEQAFQKYTALFEDASRNYNFYNNMVKNDLRVLTTHRDDLTKIITERIARIQREVYSSLCDSLLNAIQQSNYIDINLDISYESAELWGLAKRNLDQINICGNRVGGIKPKANFMSTLSRKSTKKDFLSAKIPNKKSSISQVEIPNNTRTSSSRHNSYAAPQMQMPSQSQPQNTEQLPAYYSEYDSQNNAPPQQNKNPVISNNTSQVNRAFPSAPLPPRRIEHVIALYDYNSGVEGDLKFKVNDLIEVLERTESSEDWWTGKLNGEIGVFPSNYVRLQ
ncbi:hypothetical protein BB561_003611 [Smittium simulii]|uniref:SH3 domain-containing protein n=1 Tax=Smittium simulii TaxID=133385 RepID=A0A2T9YKD2_9FUNG|nr:hypothetical protein BB561_003611 [Smittium simulii]